MINKFRRREVLRRLAYERYKAVFDVAKTGDPVEVVKAAFKLVESYKGHRYAHIARAARDTCNFIIEEEENQRVLTTPEEELPLLIGNLQHQSSRETLEFRLRGEPHVG